MTSNLNHQVRHQVRHQVPQSPPSAATHTSLPLGDCVGVGLCGAGSYVNVR